MKPAFRDSIALRWDPQSSAWIATPLAHLQWSALDLGVLRGAILVERIRTFGGKLPNVERHFIRLSAGIAALSIGWNGEGQDSQGLTAIAAGLSRLLDANRGLIDQEEDVSFVIALSPGELDAVPRTPTCMLSIDPLPWERLHRDYRIGTELVLSTWSSGASICWPSDIKSRCRLNYFLADTSLKDPSDRRLALLRAPSGGIADTAIANVICVFDDGRCHTPLHSDVVKGTSLDSVAELLRLGGEMPMVYRPIEAEELSSAREVLLTGNSGCLWHARSINGNLVGSGDAGPVCIGLQDRWIRHLGFDWRAQALNRHREDRASHRSGA